MEDSPGDDEPAAGAEFNGPPFEVDEERAFDDVKELVVMIVLVPVIFALNNTEANYGTIDLAESLVVPPVATGIGQRLFIDQLQRLKRDVQPGFVRVVLRVAHGSALFGAKGPFHKCIMTDASGFEKFI